LNTGGIVSALGAEARHFGLAAPRRNTLTSLANGMLLAVTGIGCEAAGRGARALVDAGVTALTSWGMAGGLDPALSPGTIVLPDEVVDRDGTAFATTMQWRERLRSAAIAARRPVAIGRLLTSLQPIGSVTDKARAFHETGAVAVDMESVAVAEVAAAHRLPFMAVRVVVDTAADALPRAALAASHEGSVRLRSLLGAAALTPGEIRALIKLTWRYRAASRSLAAVARSGSLSP
jgi:nucleoside phosphorylase